MFSKRVCRQLLTWSSYRRLRYSTPGPGLSHRLSHDEGNKFPMEFLTQPGPEARLPPGIYTDYGDMDSNMKETFKKVVHNEYTVLWANGGKVPSIMTEDMWEQLYHVRRPLLRQELFIKFFVAESYQLELAMREKFRVVNKDTETKPNPTQDQLIPKVITNFTKQSMNQYQTQRLNQARAMGHKLIVDARYLHKMNSEDFQNTMKALYTGCKVNAASRDPFGMMICNCHIDMDMLHYVPTVGNLTDYMEDFTDQSYLKYFPKKHLVYLTPDSRHVMKTFNPNVTYIIGGLPDCQNDRYFKAAFAAGREEHIKVERLPVHNYIRHISTSSKSLPISEVILILLALKANSGDWHAAYKSFLEPEKMKHMTQLFKLPSQKKGGRRKQDAGSPFIPLYKI